MTAHDLDAIRAHIRVQQDRSDEVARRLALVSRDTMDRRAITIRCSKSHRGGKTPKIGEVRPTAHGIFFVSRIPWAQSDATVLRPWVVETYLSRLFAVSGVPEDEDVLRATVSNLEWWRDHGSGDKSWIAQRAARTHLITEVLNLQSTAGMQTLWVRCPLHLDEFEAANAETLLRRLR